MMSKGRGPAGQTKETAVRGEGHGMSVLKDEIVRKIRILNSEGLDGREIAVSLGISRTTIYNVLSGRTWTHVK